MTTQDFKTVTIVEGDGTESQIQVPTKPVTQQTPTTTTPSTTQFKTVTVQEPDGTESQVRIPIDETSTVTTQQVDPSRDPASSVGPGRPGYRTVDIREGDQVTQLEIPITPVTVSVLKEAPSLVSNTGNSVLERQISDIDEGVSERIIKAVRPASDIFKEDEPGVTPLVQRQIAQIDEGDKQAFIEAVNPASSIFTVQAEPIDPAVEKAYEAYKLLLEDINSPDAVRIFTELINEGRFDLVSAVRGATKDLREFENRIRDIDPELQKAAQELNLSDRAAILLMDMPSNLLTEAQHQTRIDLIRKMGNSGTVELTELGQQFSDSLSEALTFGKVETRTYNQEDIKRQWNDLRLEAGEIYDKAVTEAEAAGKEVTISRQDYINRVLPTQEEYVETVIQAMPRLRELAEETGKASIPVYGTIYTWESDPNWARALGVAADVATFLPVLGLAAGFTRAGVGFRSGLRAIAISELKAPLTPILAPGQVVRAGLRTLEDFNDWFRLATPDVGIGVSVGDYSVLGKAFQGEGIPSGARNLPTSITQVRSTGTQRIPLTKGRTNHPLVINVPDEDIPSLTLPEVYKVREELTQKAVRGEVNPATGLAEAQYGSGTIGIPVPALQQKTGPVLLSGTPDLRNDLAGLVVGDIAKPGGKGAPVYFAPQGIERFAQATSSGRPVPLAEKTQRAVALGNLPDKEVKGFRIVREDSPLFKLAEDSKKPYQGTAEIETIIPPKEFSTRVEAEQQVKLYKDAGVDASILTDVGPEGTTKYFAAPNFGKPSQVLYQRDPVSGSKNLILVWGSPYSRRELAKLKLLAPFEEMKQILTPGIGFFRKGDDAQINKAKSLADQAADYYKQAEKAKAAGYVEEAKRLERRGDDLFIDASDAITRANVNQFAESTFTAGASYTGDQDVERALRTLAGEDIPTSRSVPTTGRTTTSETRIPRRDVPQETGEIGRSPVPRRSIEDSEREDVPYLPPRRTPRDTPRAERERPSLDTPPPPRRVPPPPDDPRDRPRVPDIARVDLPSLGGPEKEEEEDRVKKPAPGYSWRQGKVWIGIYAPYKEQDIVYRKQQPSNTVRVKNPTEAWNRIEKDGYNIDAQTLDEWAQWFTPRTSTMTMQNEEENFSQDFSEEEISLTEKPQRQARPRRPRIDVDIVPRIAGQRTARTMDSATSEMRRPARAPRIRQGGFTWPQGNMYIAIYPPFTEDDIVYDVKAPGGTTSVRGPKEAWNRIKKQGYEIDANTYDEWASWFTAKGETTGIEGIIVGNPESAFEGAEGGIKAFEPAVDDFFNPKNIEF